MSQHHQILIVGGGNAGISVAAQLIRKKDNLDIAIVDPSDKHYYQPAWTLVGAGEFDINKTVREQGACMPAGTTWIKDGVSTFQPEENQITTAKGNVISYDVMIVCPGIQIDWDKIEGLKDTLGKNNVSCNYSFQHAPYTWEMIKNFKGGKAVFTNPVSPIKCGGAPHKIMYLATHYWTKMGIPYEVHYLSGAGAIFAVKEYAETLNKVVKKRHIHTHFGVNVVRVDGEAKKVFYEEKNQQGELEIKTMDFDLCHAVPPMSAPDFVKHSDLRDSNNPYGYVEIDKHTLQHIRFPNVFSLGDCTNAPCSKTGAAIRKQAPVVVANVLSFMENNPLAARYDGYSACPIPTQYGKLMLAEFDYTNTPKMSFPFDQTKPKKSMWVLKKYGLPWLYWNKILKGTA